jgi:hypothetical protein
LENFDRLDVFQGIHHFFKLDAGRNISLDRLLWWCTVRLRVEVNHRRVNLNFPVSLVISLNRTLYFIDVTRQIDAFDRLAGRSLRLSRFCFPLPLQNSLHLPDIAARTLTMVRGPLTFDRFPSVLLVGVVTSTATLPFESKLLI